MSSWFQHFLIFVLRWDNQIIKSNFLWSLPTLPHKIPINSKEKFQFLHILDNHCYLFIFDSNHPKRYEIVSHCGFDCISQMISDVEILQCTWGQFVCLLFWNVYSCPSFIFKIGLFTFLLLSAFNILNINPLSDVESTNTSSLSIGCFLLWQSFPFLLKYIYFFFWLLFRATLAAYGISQARGQIGAMAVSHSHSNTGSNLRYRGY